MSAATRLIVLDRDGVINYDSPAFVKTPAEWRPLDGSLEAIAMLSQAGFTVAVASNQSGMGRGLFDRRALYAINRRMRKAVRDAGGRIDRIVYCPHRPDAGCDCRKPAPGLLYKLARHYRVPLRGVPVIGDSERDLLAAQAVEATPVLVLTGNGRATRAVLDSRNEVVETHEDLLAAARHLVARVA